MVYFRYKLATFHRKTNSVLIRGVALIELKRVMYGDKLPKIIPNCYRYPSLTSVKEGGVERD
jgi:hypothetical protein